MPTKNANKVIADNMRPVALASAIASVISLMLSGYQPLQKVEIYQKPTGLHFPAFTYVIQREFDRSKEDVEGLTLVAEIESSARHKKIMFALAGFICGLSALIAAYQEEKLEELRGYQELSRLQMAKTDIDHQTAVHTKLAAEKSLITASNLLGELLENPIYRKLKQQQLNIEEGVDDEDEQEDDTWNPFTDDQIVVTQPQVEEIIRRATSTGEKLEDAIASVTGISKGNSQFVEVIQQIKRELEQ